MKEILVETSVLIDFLQGLTTQETDNLLNSRAVCISILSYLEACKFFYKIGKVRELEFVKQKLRSFKMLELTIETCEEAAKISHSNRMALADAIIYSTGKLNSLEIITSDSDLKGLPGVIFVKKAKK